MSSKKNLNSTYFIYEWKVTDKEASSGHCAWHCVRSPDAFQEPAAGHGGLWAERHALLYSRFDMLYVSNDFGIFWAQMFQAGLLVLELSVGLHLVAAVFVGRDTPEQSQGDSRNYGNSTICTSLTAFLMAFNGRRADATFAHPRRPPNRRI